MPLSARRRHLPTSPARRRCLRDGWRWGWTMGAWAAAAGLLPVATRAAPAQTLCGDAAFPPPPAADQPPLVQCWLRDGQRDGPLPDCSGLQSLDFELLVRVSGAYKATGDLDEQLARLGAVSTQSGMTYWSFTDHRRQLLVLDSHAVHNLERRQRRGDFSAAELRSGVELFYLQTDNRSSEPSAFGMMLLRASAQTVTVRMENLSDIRMFGLLVMAPRDMQMVLTLKQQAPGLWHYRSLAGVRRLRLASDDQHRLSNLSRSVALFDHMAGRHSPVEQYR